MRTKLSLNPITGELDLVTRIDSVDVLVDFGHQSGYELDFVTVTVAAPWVNQSTRLICTPVAVSTADHDPIDVVIEQISAKANNQVTGVGFDLIVSAPNGTFGKYLINVVGV